MKDGAAGVQQQTMTARRIHDRPHRSLNKAELVRRIYQLHGGLTRSEASAVVDSILDAMKTSLLDGRSVKIQNFGVLEVTDREGRNGVDPTSGDRIFIPSHRGLSFRPSPRLKDIMERRSPERLAREIEEKLPTGADRKEAE